MIALAADLRYAIRKLRANPGFTVLAVLLVALGIGANTAMFSVVQAVLPLPLPYREPSRLCMAWKTVPAKNLEWDWTGYPAIRDWRESNRVFEDVAAVLRPEGAVVTLTGGPEPVRIQAAKVEGNLFSVLGATPRLGRTFSKNEARRGENVVVLSHGFWQSHSGGARDVLGRSLEIDRRSCTIVGVMDRSFQFPGRDTQMWPLIAADERWAKFQRFRFADAFTAIARLKGGVSLAQARAEMSAIARRLAIQYPETDAGLGVRLVPLAEQVAGPEVRRALWIVMSAVLCVLPIACTNVANLLLARGEARSKELAIRAALGAGRGQLVRQMLTESVVLSAAGGALGLIATAISLKALLALAPADLARLDGVRIDTAVLAFTLALSVATGTFFGLFPAWQAARRDPQGALKNSGGPVRMPLVAAQYALALVSLPGAGLLVRSFLALQAATPGFDPRHLSRNTRKTECGAKQFLTGSAVRAAPFALLTFTVDLPDETAGAKASAIFERAIEAIGHLPGVESAAVGGTFENHVPNGVITAGGQAPEDSQPFNGWDVSPGYFHTMGIPLRRGRIFANTEASGAVIGESMARRFWPGQDPLGKRFKTSLAGLDEGNLYTVLGVVGDRLSNGPGSATLPTMYTLAKGRSSTTMVVRTVGDPLPLAAAVRRVVRAAGPEIPSFEITTVERQLRELRAPLRFETTLLSVFAALATLLAAAGIYGLLRQGVAQRSKEIGIRIALGERGSDVVRLVLGQGMRGVAIGLLAGLLVSYAATRVLASGLYGVTATDPSTPAGVVVVLIVVALAASGPPARRAVKVDPIAALRHE